MDSGSELITSAKIDRGCIKNNLSSMSRTFLQTVSFHKKVSQRPNRIQTLLIYWKTKTLSQKSSEKLPKTQFSNLQHSNSLKGLENKEKRQAFIPTVCIGDPNAGVGWKGWPMSGFSRSVPLVFIIERRKRQQLMRNYENSDPVQESKPTAMLDWFGYHLIKKTPLIKRVFFY